MSEARSASDTATIDAAMADLFEQRIVFNRLIGLRQLPRVGGRASMAFDMREELVGHYQHGRLHGGVIATVLDAAGALAIMGAVVDAHPAESPDTVMERFAHLGTVDLRVDYLRPGLGARFVASGETVRLGRRLATASMRLENDEGRLIATGNATYVVS